MRLTPFPWIVTDWQVLPGCHRNCDILRQTGAQGRHPTAHPPWASGTFCFNEINWIPLLCTSSKPDAGCPSRWGASPGLPPQSCSLECWDGVWGECPCQCHPPQLGQPMGRACAPQSHHPALFHATPTSPASRVSVPLNYRSGPPTVLTTRAARCICSKRTCNPHHLGMHHVDITTEKWICVDQELLMMAIILQMGVAHSLAQRSCVLLE